MALNSIRIRRLALRVVAVMAGLAVSLAEPAAGVAAVLQAEGSPVKVSVLSEWSAALEARLAEPEAQAAAVLPPVGPGAKMKMGSRGERVDRLAAQLVARGFLPGWTAGSAFDQTLDSALRAFQRSEGMKPDGVIGEDTIGALDRTPAAAAAMLRTTATAMRALAASAPEEVLVVNIPSQTAWLIQDGKVTFSMRVVVGRPSRPTPLLTDQITDIILNPTWTAPPTVLAQDKLPSLRQTGHPGIEGAVIYLDGQEVDPATVDWSTVSVNRVRIVQSPGDQNALGRFKFNLTNSESIYLHDTNDHSVFERQGRALSSGCVRLAHPRQLAELLLGREGWTPERITRGLQAKRPQSVGLARPLPVRLVYWLATLDESGAIRLHRDLYAGAGAQAATGSLPRAEIRKAAAPAARLTDGSGELRGGGGSAAGISALAPRPVNAPVVATPMPASVPAPAAPSTARCGDNCAWGMY